MTNFRFEGFNVHTLEKGTEEIDEKTDGKLNEEIDGKFNFWFDAFRGISDSFSRQQSK